MAVELQEGEVIEQDFKGDYWEKFLFTYSQKTGSYQMTTHRIHFQGGFATVLDIPYSDITSVELCNVGPLIQFVPTGIKVTTKDGKSYKLSMMGRKTIFEYLQKKVNQ